MSGWSAALLGLIAVLNPPGLSRTVAWSPRNDPATRRSLMRVVAIAGVALVGLVLVTGPLLELLDLSTQTFRLGAAVVMGLTGGHWLLAPTRPITETSGGERGDLAMGLTLFLGPGPVFAAMSGGADGGLVAGLVSVLAAAAISAAALRAPEPRDPVAGAAARLVGAAAVVIAIAIGLDSVRSV